MSKVSIELDLTLADHIAKFRNDPLGWVNFSFDWGVGELEGFSGPDLWQENFLKEWGRQLEERNFDGVNPVMPIRMSVVSGHGVGKSCITSWIILFIMSTRPFCKGVVTANTGDQLKTKTWSELGRWHNRLINSHWFNYSASRGSMSLTHRNPKYASSWRVDAATSEENNSEAFAGLHAANSTPFFIFDEASAIPSKIWEVASGAMSDGSPHWFAFGNGTRNDGAFYDTFNSMSHRWTNWRIDSRTAKMTNKKLIDEYIRDYGIDSDYVRVRILGQFPRAGDTQFFPTDIVQEAMKREPVYLTSDPLICGIDLARGGEDNCFIQFRRGKDAKSEKVYKIKGEDAHDSMVVVSKIAMVLDRHKPDVVFSDQGSMGGPINDRLRQLGYNVVDVNFGGKADDEKLYGNKTAEMAGRLKSWLMSGGAIPDDPQLEKELTFRNFAHNDKQQLMLEKKRDMKKRLGVSPDWADSLYLTFASNVEKPNPQSNDHYLIQNNSLDYDPLDSLN